MRAAIAALVIIGLLTCSKWAEKSASRDVWQPYDVTSVPPPSRRGAVRPGMTVGTLPSHSHYPSFPGATHTNVYGATVTEQYRPLKERDR